MHLTSLPRCQFMLFDWIPHTLCIHADEASQTGEGLSWRQAPSDFGIGGRYPVKEVFSAAYEAWKGEHCSKCILCCQVSGRRET